MGLNRHTVDAFSLPAVVVISALVMMLIVFAFSLKTLDFHNHGLYSDMKQARLDLHSATALYMCDSTVMGGADSIYVNLYDEGEDVVVIGKQRWGMYESVSIRHSKDDPFAKRYMMGRNAESPYRAAFWLSDRNRALSLGGGTSISGPVYVPYNGVNYSEIGDRKFHGAPISSDRLKLANRYLPELSLGAEIYLDSLKGMSDQSIDYRSVPGAGQYRSFEEPTIYAHCHTPSRVELHLNGNIVLYGERLVLSGKSDVHDIMILARSVIIEDGFHGSAQIFCEDTVRIGTNVRLDYPSGAIVDASGFDFPYIAVEEGSQVNGYLGIINGEKDYYVQEKPNFKMRCNSLVRGLVYMDGLCDIAGTIKGAAYVRDCFYQDSRSTYVGTLYDVSIDREDSLAFPLLLDGPYRRKIIKNLY